MMQGKTLLLCFVMLSCILCKAYAQDIEEICWKSESYVRDLYGEPETIVGPTGTQTSYTLWKYSNFSVAFANQRAFHLFDKDSLTRFELDEDR